MCHVCIFLYRLWVASRNWFKQFVTFWLTVVPSFPRPNFSSNNHLLVHVTMRKTQRVLFFSEGRVFTSVMEVEVSWVDGYPLSPDLGVLQSPPLGSLDPHPPWTTQLSTGQLLSLKRPTRPWNNFFWLYCSACLLVLQAHSLNFPWIEGRKAPLTCLLLLTAITSL